jgi:mycothione reductase
MTTRAYDLVIVGAGSGNMLPTKELAGWRIAVVDADRLGGTWLNRGCIPSKMLVHTANLAHTVPRCREVRHKGNMGCG